MADIGDNESPAKPAGWRPRIALALALAITGGLAAAQTPAPLPMPNVRVAQHGTVFAIAALSDGSHVVGGDFFEVHDPTIGASHRRENLARFNADGSLDLGWNPGVSGSVRALAVDAGDNVYVGGSFDTAGGLPRYSIAKVEGQGTGMVDPDWGPFVGGPVFTLAYDADDDALFVGGAFNTIGGLLRSNVAKLYASGTGQAVPSWATSANAIVWSLFYAGAGTLYVGGDFTSIGGASRAYVAKLSTDGFVDGTWNPSPNAQVYAFARALDGGIYAGGRFTFIGGQNRFCLAKLSATGTGAAVPTWSAPTNSTVFSLSAGPTGLLYAGGAFTTVAGFQRSYSGMVNSAGIVDQGWNPPFNDWVFAVAQTPINDVILGGKFSLIGNRAASALARYDTFGVTPPKTYFAEYSASVSSIAGGPDGAAFVGGRFSTVTEGLTGYVRRNLFRLRPGGTLDPAWNPGTDWSVNDLALDGAGNLLVAGGFGTIGGQPRGGLARVSAGGTGAVDANWRPNADGEVSSVAIAPDGSIIAAGYFGAIGGLPRQGLAKLSPAGAGNADPAFNASLQGYYLNLAVDSSGSLYVGGGFDAIGGMPRANLAKLSVATGAVDPDWNPAPNSIPMALVPDGAGRLYVGGYMNFIGGVQTGNVARIEASGTGAADASWTPEVLGSTLALALDGAGALIVGGGSLSAGAETRENLARVYIDGTGVVDPDFNPAPRGAVYALATSGGGLIYAGGTFSQVGAVPSKSVAVFATDRIHADGFE